VAASWKKVKVKQGGSAHQMNTQADEKGVFVLYQTLPNAQPVTLYKA
jgi:hypothetical protein